MHTVRSRKKNGFASSIAREHYIPGLLIQPVHKTINLKLNLKQKKASGFVSIVVKAQRENEKKLVLDAYDLNIEKIEDIAGKTIEWTYDGKSLRINWQEPFKQDEHREVKVFYSVTEPVAGLYFFVPDEKYPGCQEFVFADNETQKARYWLPCIDHPAVRCTLDIILTADKKYTILANGKLAGEKINDGNKEVHWHSDIPTPTYLTTFVAAELISYQDRNSDTGHGKIPVAYFASKAYTPEELKLSFGRTPEILEWFYKKLQVPTAHPKYFQYVTPHRFGAMENMSLVSWDDTYIIDEVYAREENHLTEQINVHETAHNWFGNLVGTNEFTHSWLKEAWATYMEAVWYEDKYNDDEFKYRLYEFSRIYFQESESDYSRAIVTNKYDASWDMFDAHLYHGASWRIHMLRKLCGEKIFWKAVTDYLQTFQGEVIETVDFQRILEKHSKISFQKFFDQWLYRPGYPKLQAEFEYDEDNKLFSLTINQKQKEPFSFSLDIEWETNEGSFEKRTVEIKDTQHIFNFQAEKKPLQLNFDPECKVLFSLDFNPGKDLLLRQLRHGSTIARILAAHELAKQGSLSNVKAIGEAYRAETFWGVKSQLAKALSEAESFDAVDILLELLETEKDPAVLKSVIGALKNKRDEKVARAVIRFLETEKELYEARAAALNVLGSQREEKYFDFLKNYQPGKDRKHIVISGLYHAISAIRSEQAVIYLLEKLKYGEETDSVRPHIVEALGSTAPWAGKLLRCRIADTLADIIRKEKNEVILLAAAEQLSNFKDPSLAKVLELAKTKVEHGEHTSINSYIEAVQKGENSEEELKNLRKELEEVKEKNKEIRSKLEKIELKQTEL